MFEGFSSAAKAVVDAAHVESNQQFTGTQHLLVGILRADPNIARVFSDFGVTLERVRSGMASRAAPISVDRAAARWTEESMKALEMALREKIEMDDETIDVGHIALAISNRECHGSVQILMDLGVSVPALRAELMRRLGRSTNAPDPQWPERRLENPYDSPSLAALSHFFSSDNPRAIQVVYKDNNHAVVTIAFANQAARYEFTVLRNDYGWCSST